MNKFLQFLILSLLLVACDDVHQSNANTKNKETNSTDKVVSEKTVENEQDELPKGMILHDKDTLVPVDYYNKAIYWDLKYATADNFMHRVLYDTLKVVYVQNQVAKKLAACQTFLSKQHPSYHLLVYDGLRPLSVQREMWEALDTIPVAERVKFVSNPANGSVHNYGAAVDITICVSKKSPLDMGAGYDDIRKIAYPSLESQFLASGELSKEQLANRQLLRKVLRHQGFINIPSEWWHFNEFSRNKVKNNYSIVLNEVY
jgi:D-alanyl-D-alanine dipeptidase